MDPASVFAYTAAVLALPMGGLVVAGMVAAMVSLESRLRPERGPRARTAPTRPRAEPGTVRVERHLVATLAESDGLRVWAQVRRQYDNGPVETVFETAVPRGWDLVEGGSPGEPATGDPAFDGRLGLAGEERVVLPLLGAEARAALVALGRAGRLEVRDGQLSWTLDGVWTDPPSRVETCVKPLLAAVKPLWAAEALGALAIEDLVRRDPEPEVRRRAYRLLSSVDEERARALAPELRDHAHPSIRAQARLVLGDLAGLREIAVDGAVPPHLRREALRRLDPADDATGDVVLYLLRERADLAEEAVVLATAAPRPATTGALAELCRQGSLAQRTAAARAVAELGATDAEDALVAALDADEPLRTTAILALAAVGTEASLPALERWTSPGVKRDLREACVSATKEIRGRAQWSSSGSTP